MDALDSTANKTKEEEAGSNKLYRSRDGVWSILWKAVSHFCGFATANMFLRLACKYLVFADKEKYSSLINWCISFVHSAYASYLSVKALLFNNKELLHDVFIKYKHNNFTSFNIEGFRDQLLPWTLGYFCWDLIDMPASGAGFTASNVLHHIFGAIGATLVIAHGKCQPFAFSALFAETNTVFLALRAICRDPLVLSSFFGRSEVSFQDGPLVYKIITVLQYSSFLLSRIYIHALGLKQSILFAFEEYKMGPYNHNSLNFKLGIFGSIGGLVFFANNIYLLRRLIKADFKL